MTNRVLVKETLIIIGFSQGTAKDSAERLGDLASIQHCSEISQTCFALLYQNMHHDIKVDAKINLEILKDSLEYTVRNAEKLYKPEWSEDYVDLQKLNLSRVTTVLNEWPE